MIQDVSISNFRGVRAGAVNSLSPISILVGPNNSGKSTVLEALTAVANANAASAVVDSLLRRGGPALDALRHVVYRGAAKANVTLQTSERPLDFELQTFVARSVERMRDVRAQGLAEEAACFLVRCSIPTTSMHCNSEVYVDPLGKMSPTYVRSGTPLPLPRTTLVDVQTARERGALEDAYTDIDRAKRVKDVVNALKRSMPGLVDLRILKTEDDFILHMFSDREGEEPVPAYLAGDGLKRFLELASAALEPNIDLVLLEEPESFQHPRYLAELSALLLASAEKGRQIILSTHSIELIDLLLHSDEDSVREWPTVHRLRLANDELSAVSLKRQDALTARDELLEDLRA